MVAAGRTKAPKRRAENHARWSPRRKRRRVGEIRERGKEPWKESVGEQEAPTKGTDTERVVEIRVASDEDAWEEENDEAVLSEEREPVKRKAGPVPEGGSDELHAEEDFGDEEADGVPEAAGEDDDSFATAGPEFTEDWESFKALKLEDLSAYGLAHGEVKTGKRNLVPCGVVSTNGSVQWVWEARKLGFQPVWMAGGDDRA